MSPSVLQQGETLLWLKARSVVMYVLSAVFVLCIGLKLMIDYCQASQSEEILLYSSLIWSETI
jgi:hypothetical protein